MAVFKSTPITSDVQNSIDNQTFSKWRGINVAKKKINENKSEKPKQLQQRARWRKALELEKLFRLSSEIGFPSRPVTQDYHNAFLSTNANKRAIEVSEDLEVTVNYDAILCSKGQRVLPRTFTVSADSENRTLTFTHSVEARGSDRDKTDELYAMVVAPELKDAELFELGSRIDAEPVTISLPENWSVDAIEVYVFVLSADGKKASDSRHLVVE